MWSYRDENEGFKNCIGMKAADGNIWKPLLTLCVQTSAVDSTTSLCTSLWQFSRSSFSSVCLSACRGVALLFIALCLCGCSWCFLGFALSLLVCLPCSSGLHFYLLKPWMLSPKLRVWGKGEMTFVASFFNCLWKTGIFQDLLSVSVLLLLCLNH